MGWAELVALTLEFCDDTPAKKYFYRGGVANKSPHIRESIYMHTEGHNDGELAGEPLCMSQITSNFAVETGFCPPLADLSVERFCRLLFATYPRQEIPN